MTRYPRGEAPQHRFLDPSATEALAGPAQNRRNKDRGVK